MKRELMTAITCVLACGAPALAGAQCTTPSSATSTVRTCSVIVSSNSPVGDWVVNRLGTMRLSSVATLALTTPTTAAYDANTLQEPSGNARTATITANAPWTLSVKSNTASLPSYWTAANDATYGAFVAAAPDKPPSDLNVSTTLGSGYLALPADNTGSTALLTLQAATASRVVTMYFATTWLYQFDRPGTYTLPFLFNLAIP